MAAARPLYKTDEVARMRERIARLERALDTERQLRKQAELNASRFHALMLKARVDLIRAGGGS